MSDLSGNGRLYIGGLIYAGSYRLEPRYIPAPRTDGERETIGGYAGVFHPFELDPALTSFFGGTLMLEDGTMLWVPMGRRVAADFEVEIAA